MASDLDALRRDLARLIGSEGVLEPHAYEAYAHDATIQRGLRGTPDAVVCPADARSVARVLAWCYDHDVALVPRGGGTGLAGGAVPVGGGVVCSLERLNRILEIEPQLWRMSVQAGVLTAHVHRLARENGLMFAPDPGAAEQSQIGGNIATNAAGPHAFKYGPTGGFVSGLEVVLAPGEITNLGAKVSKDVAGYDLRGLLVGSEGTLGVVTAAHLRLLPAPTQTEAVAVVLEGVEQGQRLLLELIGSGIRPAVLEFLDEAALSAAARSFPGELGAEARFMLLLELDGTGEELARESAELRDLLKDAAPLGLLQPNPSALWRWRAGLNGAIAAQRGGKVSEDISVPVEHLARAIEGVHRIGSEHGLATCTFGHAGDGVLHATFMVDLQDEQETSRALAAAQAALRLAITLEGSVTGEHGCGWVKRTQLAQQLGPAALAAHWLIKDSLDPKGLLNPGKKLLQRPG
ncbi:MAG TPA: FAD-linked oxidase C-terminal domain-containing protein [Solirubrobacteraceae bacterium]|jgi:glycolate oxidase subunit GlcD